MLIVLVAMSAFNSFAVAGSLVAKGDPVIVTNKDSIVEEASSDGSGAASDMNFTLLVVPEPFFADRFKALSAGSV